MPLYLLALDGQLFEQRLRPALAAAWRRHSFAPCQQMCAELLPHARAFADRYHVGDEPLLQRVAAGLTFDRDFWRFLVGELLWFGAEEIPELQITPAALCHLLAPGHGAGDTERDRYASIQQVYFGSRDLCFGGGYYRPDHAGYNAADDVQRLNAYLQALEPERLERHGPDRPARPRHRGGPRRRAGVRARVVAAVAGFLPALRVGGCVIVCEDL